MKHLEITHRTVERIIFWVNLLFFGTFGLSCLFYGMPVYVWGTALAVPLVIGICTFVPPLQGVVQSYAAVIGMEIAATVFAFASGKLSTMHGVFLLIMCLAGLYRRVGLIVGQIVYVTLMYITAYLLYPEQFFSDGETPVTEITRLTLFYLGSGAVLLLIIWFRNAVTMMELRSQSITELYKMVEKEKLKAEAGTREKADFLANMSHEMRTPMIAVCGMSELLLQNNLTPLEEEYVRTIQNSANNLLSMVNDVLDFSKIEANMMDLDEAPYQVETMVSDVANIINVRIGEKDIAFVIELDPALPASLIGDEMRIRQILINLLNNAVKFTDTGEIGLKIDYSLDEWNHSWLTIKVSDTGIGITREDQKKLFSQFTQVGSDHKRSIEGTGLGLVISQRLANKMNGNITLESEYGKGSTFTVTIEQRVADATELAVLPDPDGFVAYLYEPNPHYYANLKGLLERLGVPVMTVSDIALWDYYNADRFGALLFFDYMAGIASVNTFASKIHRMRLVALIERTTFVDAGIKDNILMMHKPLLTGQLAALIRGENLDEFHRKKKLHSNFYVPDARIMVVDDNAVNLRVTAGLLNIFKPQVTMVSGGREAYELLQKDPGYDMIFMDHMMPDWDGIETVGHIRAMEGEYYKRVPIIALSANVSQEAREKFIREGMNDFVGKPMSADTLAAVLKKYIPPEKQLTEYAEKVDPLMTLNRPRDEYISAAEDSDRQIQIEGIDAARGVFNIGGSADAYISVLNVFLRDGRDKLVYIEKYAQEGNLKAYRIESHSVKSVGASIGAQALADIAKQHEEAAQNGDLAFVQAHYAELTEEYTRTLTRVEDYLRENGQLDCLPLPCENEEEDASRQPISNQKKHNCVVNVIRHIERFNSDAAIDELTELLSYRLDKSDRSAVLRAIHQLSDYMFDEAIATLRPL